MNIYNIQHEHRKTKGFEENFILETIDIDSVIKILKAQGVDMTKIKEIKLLEYLKPIEDLFDWYEQKKEVKNESTKTSNV